MTVKLKLITISFIIAASSACSPHAAKQAQFKEFSHSGLAESENDFQDPNAEVIFHEEPAQQTENTVVDEPEVEYVEEENLEEVQEEAPEAPPAIYVEDTEETTTTHVHNEDTNSNQETTPAESTPEVFIEEVTTQEVQEDNTTTQSESNSDIEENEVEFTEEGHSHTNDLEVTEEVVPEEENTEHLIHPWSDNSACDLAESKPEGVLPKALSKLKELELTHRITNGLNHGEEASNYHNQDIVIDGQEYTAAFDLSIRCLTQDEIKLLLDTLANNNIVAWYRQNGADGWSGADHIHAIWVFENLKIQLYNQVESWINGYNGLASNKHYEFWQPRNEVKEKIKIRLDSFVKDDYNHEHHNHIHSEEVDTYSFNFNTINSIINKISSDPRYDTSLKNHDRPARGCIPIEQITVEEARTIMKSQNLTTENATEFEERTLGAALVRIQQLNGGILRTGLWQKSTPFPFRYVDKGKGVSSRQFSNYIRINRRGSLEYGKSVAQVVHEYAHLIGNNGAYGSYNYSMKNVGRCLVSNYANKNRNEQFAEVFTAFITEPHILLTNQRTSRACKKAFDFFAEWFDEGHRVKECM